LPDGTDGFFKIPSKPKKEFIYRKLSIKNKFYRERRYGRLFLQHVKLKELRVVWRKAGSPSSEPPKRRFFVKNIILDRALVL
jgi:hypothetical protein